MSKSRHRRPEALLDLFLSSGGNAGQRATMKGVERREDFESAILVAESARQLEQPFVGLAPAVAEKTFARSEQAHQRVSQPTLLLVVIKVRHMNQLSRLLEQRLNDRRVRMAQRRDRDPASQIEIALARHIINV